MGHNTSAETMVCQLHPLLSKKVLVTVTHGRDTSQFNDCNVLHVGIPLTTTWKLLQVQNAAAQMLTGTGRYHHVTPLLQALIPIYRLLPIKHYMGLEPKYLQYCLILQVSAWPLGDLHGQRGLLQVPLWAEPT